MASTVTELIRRRMMGVSKPYDAEVEWLSSGGTAYINTGIVPKDTPRIVINILVTSSNVDNDLFGFKSNEVPSFIGDLTTYAGGDQKFLYYRYYGTGFAGTNLKSSVAPNEWAEWDLGYICKCNDITLDILTRQSFASNTQILYLFRGRNIAALQMRVGATQIYDGDTLMRNFIPVRVGQVGYMYDKVSGQLFGNDGTGDFILGNDI